MNAFFSFKILFSSEFVTALSQIRISNRWKRLIYCVPAKTISSVFSLRTFVRVFYLLLSPFISILLPGGRFATIKVKKNPRTVLEHGSGISFFVHMELLHLFLPNGIIAYANVNCKIHLFFIKQKFILIWYHSIRTFVEFFWISLLTKYIIQNII